MTITQIRAELAVLEAKYGLNNYDWLDEAKAKGLLATLELLLSL